MQILIEDTLNNIPIVSIKKIIIKNKNSKQSILIDWENNLCVIAENKQVKEIVKNNCQFENAKILKIY